MSKMTKKLPILLIMTLLAAAVSAQEFRCGVQVNYQKLQSTTQQYESSDTKTFETMKSAIEDFVNTRRWTNLELEEHEKLDCSISIILDKRTTATDFQGQMTIQLRRPVFNSNYTSGLFNYMEGNDFTFSFNESRPLEFDMGTYYDNLSSTLAYYCYIMLGIYFDSYAPNGGDPYFQMAQQVVQAVDDSKFAGWNSNNGRNRYWFMENHTNSAYAALHEAYYDYHRMGLDMMTKDQPKARQAVIESLRKLQTVNKKKSNLMSVQQFVDVKIQEIVSIFTPAPAQEQKQVYDLIKDISPINVVKLKDFNTK